MLNNEYYNKKEQEINNKDFIMMIKFLTFVSLLFASLMAGAVANQNNKNNRTTINLFKEKKAVHSFGGKALAKNQLDESDRPIGEGEIEVEDSLRPPNRVINLRSIQKSVFEENKAKKTDTTETTN